METKTEKRGGKRPGSGRKPTNFKTIAKALGKEAALSLLEKTDANSHWRKLINSDDERISLETLKYLTDRAFGKAAQQVDVDSKHSGEINVTIRRIGA